MRQEDEADGPQDTGKAQEPEGSAEKAGSKKDKYQKAQAIPLIGMTGWSMKLSLLPYLPMNCMSGK